ncbi:MAG: MarR family winged helix-turn-helix transcriptional regulator [Coriobacteriia bacterium]|nr:MarR family winged helix-turn-helix transcriptional regulator [Coriobacteriia bacterium]
MTPEERAPLPATEGIVLMPQLRKLFLPLGHQVGVLTCNVLSPLCKTCGITVQQFYLLAEVKAEPGRTISELCNKSGLLLANFSVTFRKLERMGLVTKQPSDRDRRAHTLHLTPEGEALLDEIDAEWNHQLDSLFVEATPDELRTILEGLQALKGLIERVR